MISFKKAWEFLFAAEEEGKLRKAILSPFCFLSFFYGAGVRLRIVLYRWGIFRTHTLPCKVVSVGNLTMGGTGKTPFVALLAEMMQSKGIRTAILSRGYKGSFAGPFGVVSDGRTILMDVRQAGDEPFFLANKLKGIPVFIGGERRHSGRAAVDQFQVRTVILDDGFQHLSLKRDLNLLLIDSRTPLGNGWLFPRGALREPPEQATRADAVILTKADRSDNIEKLKEKFIRWASDCPVFAVRYAPIAILDKEHERVLPLETLRERKTLAFTGIANPLSFRRTLEDLGTRIAGFRTFPDHYWYKPDDFSGLLREGKERGVAALVTTEKDEVRLQGFPKGEIPLWVLSVQHDFIGQGRKQFEEFLWSKLDQGKKG
jgi:tetraacyldisaccharide 4'-kinase